MPVIRKCRFVWSFFLPLITSGNFVIFCLSICIHVNVRQNSWKVVTQQKHYFQYDMKCVIMNTMKLLMAQAVCYENDLE